MATDDVVAPTDEIESAEATLVVLQDVLARVASADLSRATPCTEFNVAKLTDHLMNSITAIGGAAGAILPPRDPDAALLTQVTASADAALDAWRRRGLDGAVSIGPSKAPAIVAAGILSIEFLVHAWDYAIATGQHVTVPEPVADYVLGLASRIITPQGRAAVGFADPVDVSADADAFDRLIAFTGRSPVG
ncbi:MAG TPA: TIGR03086 family metal-binding protein [Mycobacterium sp.]|nr:TIGR03086 family metal-binding protein [Mycobacterium sp.]